jgi:hypothetical protein
MIIPTPPACLTARLRAAREKLPSQTTILPATSDGSNTLFSWFVPSTAAGNMSVASSTSSATVGGTADVTISWSGLTAGTKYLGRISYGDGSSEIGSTLVSVNP